MKNSKKIVAVIIALSMMLSTFTTAFAAVPTTAKNLNALGLLSNITEEDMGAELNRAIGIAMVMKSLGYSQEEATAKAEDSTFTDMDDYPWAEGFVALAYEAGITTGKVAGETFDPAGAITAKEFVTFQLRALGYDTAEAWDNTATLLENAGISADLADASFDKAEAADVMYAALIADLQGEDATGTLIEKLVADGAADEAAAVAQGLVEATPEALEVVSVTANNLKQLVVTFSKALDVAGDETNYELTDGTSAAITATADFALSENGKVVTITLANGEEFGQQETVELTVDGLVAEDETELDEVVVKDILVLDMTIPTVVSAEVVGNDTIKVNFSEPMAVGLLINANYQVDDGTLNIKNVTAGTTNMSAYVELYSDLEDGDYSIEVSDIEDFEGFTALATTLNVTVVEDASAPVVVGFEDADEDSVVLIFDEDIEIADGTATNFYHTNSNNPVAGVVDATDIDGNKLTLDFTGSELPAGTVYIYIEEDSVNDLWDNENDKIKVIVTVTLDETSPAVDGDVDVTAQDTIEITFTEDIVTTDATFTLLDEDAEEVDNDVTVNVTNEVLELDFDDDLYGDYTIVIEDLEDTAGNVMADTSLTFTVDDETKPVASDFSAVVYDSNTADQIIRIDFDEEMAVTGQYSVLDITKYEIQGTSLEDLNEDAISITAIKDNTGVEIVIPNSELVVVATDVITIGRIADAASNYTTALINDITVVAEGTVAISKAEFTDNATIVVTLDEELDTVEANDFVILAGDGSTVITPAKVKHTVNSDDESVFTFTLVDTDADTVGYNAEDTNGTFTVTTVVTPDSDNMYGEALEASASVSVADAIAPMLAEKANLSSDDVDDVEATTTTTIVLTFVEDIKAATVSIVTFEVGGGDYEVTDAVVSTNTITLTVTNADSDDLVGVSVEQKAAIQDISGNVITSIDTEVGNF